MRFLIAMFFVASIANAQDQSLPEVGYELPGGLIRLSGAMHNLEQRLGECARMPARSEFQIGQQIRCRLTAWDEYYHDSGTRPCKKDCEPVRHGQFLVCE